MSILELLNGAEEVDEIVGTPLAFWIGPINGGRGGGDNLGILEFFTTFKSNLFTPNSLPVTLGWENGTLLGDKNLCCSILLTVNLGWSMALGGKNLEHSLKKKLMFKCCKLDIIFTYIPGDSK